MQWPLLIISRFKNNTHIWSPAIGCCYTRIIHWATRSQRIVLDLVFSLRRVLAFPRFQLFHPVAQGSREENDHVTTAVQVVSVAEHYVLKHLQKLFV